jgi:predicted alpha/beta superfamily hydrolase
LEDLGPFALDHTHTHDFTAAATGRTYRTWVATSAKKDPGQRRPVLYALDANFSFGSVVEAARMCAFAGLIPPVLVVGVGYPVLMPAPMFLRDYELTPSTDAGARERAAKLAPHASQVEHGGAEGFLRFITEELAPAIEDVYGGDPDDRALSGFSLGGLFAAYALLQDKPAFRRFIIGSPSLWWDNRVLFEAEERRAKGPKSLAARVFVSAGEEEEMPGGPLPPSSRMVSNALEFAVRLSSRGYDGLEIEHQTILRAGHTQSPMLVHGLRSVYRGHPGIQRPPGA